MDRCRRAGGRRPRAASDDRVQAVELLVGVEVDDEAASATGAHDADLGGEHAAQLGFQVLQIVAEWLPLRGHRYLAALSTHELLGLADRQLALEHDGENRAL